MSGGPRPEAVTARSPAAHRRRPAVVTTVVVVLALVTAGSVAALIALRSEPAARVTIDATIRTPQVLGVVRENASIAPSGATGTGGNILVPLRQLLGPLSAPTPGTTVPATSPTVDEATATTSGTTATPEAPTTGPTTSRPTTSPPTSSETSPPTTTPPSTTGTAPTTTGPTMTTGTDTSGPTTLQLHTDRPVPPEAVPALALPPVAEVPTEEREQLYCRVLAEPELTEAYVLPPCQVVEGPADDDDTESQPQTTEATAARTPAPIDRPAEEQDTGTATTVPFVQQGLAGPGGSRVPAETAAEHLRARLAEVRSRPQSGGQGRPGGQPPKVREELLGMQASINVQAEGLAGEPLALFWRLSAADGADVLPATWVTPVLASRLQPGTNSDEADLSIWIPLPRNPGPFVLDVFVVREADGELLGSQRLEPVA